MARTFGPQDRPWKWRAVESEENQKQVFSLFPPPLEIAKKRDFHIPTAATAILSFPTSNPKKRTRHTLWPLIPSRFHPCRRLRKPTALLAHAHSYPHQTAKRPIRHGWWDWMAHGVYKSVRLKITRRTSLNSILPGRLPPKKTLRTQFSPYTRLRQRCLRAI